MNRTLALVASLTLLSPLRQETEAWITPVQSPQYFAVQVEDVDRSVAWYAEAFGLEEIGGSEAEDGAWRIENLRNDSLFVEIVFDQRAKPIDFGRGFGKVGFFVPDIDKAADSIEAATGTRPRVLDFERFNLRLLQLRDPDDNIIQIHAERE